MRQSELAGRVVHSGTHPRGRQPCRQEFPCPQSSWAATWTPELPSAALSMLPAGPPGAPAAHAWICGVPFAGQLARTFSARTKAAVRQQRLGTFRHPSCMQQHVHRLMALLMASLYSGWVRQEADMSVRNPFAVRALMAKRPMEQAAMMMRVECHVSCSLPF